jgi:acetylornithine/N-succinyldiaminopimelate aminotransferase
MATTRNEVDTQTVIQMDAEYMMTFVKRHPVVFVRGDGVKLWDTDGKEYLDFLAGIGVNGIGHSHPGLSAAIAKQAAELMHVSNLFYVPQQPMLGKRVVELSGLGKAFFCNSGAEANEAAIKLARKWSKQAYGPHKHEIITFYGSFHGRTMATVTATAQPKYHEGFEPMLPGFQYVPFNDLAALEAVISPATCAIMFEPIQGESGVHPATREFMSGVRKLCDDQGLLLILDEVQSGLGRTGKWFAHQHYGVKPDIMTLAKTLGGGFPIGACVATDNVAAAFVPGNHSSTFGGNPLACAAALAALGIIEQENLIENSAQVGTYMKDRLLDLKARRDDIIEVRGVGLMLGVEFSHEKAPEIGAECLRRGLVVNSVGKSVIRMLPPLIVRKEHVDSAMEVLSDSIDGIS